MIVTLVPIFARAQTTRETIVNPGFERGAEGWGWITSAAAAFEIDKSTKFAGEQSYRIVSSSKFQPDVYCRMSQTIGGLKENTAYRIGAWVKARGTGIAWLGGGPGWQWRVPFPRGSFEWQHIESVYVTHPGETSLEIMVVVESETKSLWLDDFSIVEDASRTAQLLAERERKKKETVQKLARLPGERSAQLARVNKSMADKPQLANDSYIRAGLALAERFVHRITSHPKQSDEFSVLQAEEVGVVLDQLEQMIQATTEGKRSVVASIPSPGNDRPVLHDGALWVKDGNGERPFYFVGFGHFNQIFVDLPLFQKLGVTVVQDGRAGPSGMNEDGSFNETALQTIEDITRAGKFGIKVDWLASPHYFPKWALAQAPDLPNGNPHWLNFQIDHPVARKVIQQWLEKMTDALKNQPSLMSICLSNEPAYEQGGREPYSRPLYEKFLQQKHGTIEKLNALYGTKYESFTKVDVAGKGWPADVGAQRAFYDWCTFNQQHWADFHQWMHDIVKQRAPNIPTHAKTMAFFAMDRDRLKYGVDPELFSRATDMAGCDPHAFFGGEQYAYDWQNQEFWYDLLHSFRGQAVFNSENHIIPDGTGPSHIPAGHTYSIYWQGALHHQAATTIWAWEEAGAPELAGSLYFRPANLYAAGKTMLDLNRLAFELESINRDPAKVAILYSVPSIYWEQDYTNAVQQAVAAVQFLGQRVTFVSETQLSESRRSPANAKVQVIIVPHATHVRDKTIEAIKAFANAGGHVVFLGDDCLKWDQYHRPRKANMSDIAPIHARGDKALTSALYSQLTSAKLTS
ncbi:MAG TPA: alpha-amylase family protein, partial [Tepidisphaeraceae bacterium]|nr:alpha-amylase family protein [Tepidisphaeraceae bacterium]